MEYVLPAMRDILSSGALGSVSNSRVRSRGRPEETRSFPVVAVVPVPDLVAVQPLQLAFVVLRDVVTRAGRQEGVSNHRNDC